MTFGAHKLFFPSCYSDTCTKFDNCCRRYIATCGKKLYSCTPTFWALNYCSGSFFQISQLCTRSGAHKLYHSEPFLDYANTNFDTCCQCYVATCGKKIYRCTSTVSALNNGNGIFLKSLGYLYEMVCTNFSADFWTFRNF